MSVLEVITLPNDLLRQKSAPVEVFDQELRDFAQDMIDTMHDSRGIGLAAVQVASLVRMLVIDISKMPPFDGEDQELSDEEIEKIPAQPEIYINPEITHEEGQIEYDEGCLSIPGVYGVVQRKAKITVKYQDLKGEFHELSAEGMRAIVLQHEMDHLNGVLFLDHLSAFKRTLTLQKYNKLRLQKLKDGA